MVAGTGRTNRQWLEDLDDGNPEYSHALEDLRKYLLTGLSHSFRGFGKLNREQLEDFCQDALIRILEKRPSYSGQALFTTWAMKVAVNLVLSEIRKSRWKDVSLNRYDHEEGFFYIKAGGILSSTEKAVQRREMAGLCNRLIHEVLSDKQRAALSYHMKYGMPLDEIARRTGSSRNAVYKLLHDARKRLKAAMESQGISGGDISDLGDNGG